jgi:hypothetical protein
MRNEAEFEAQLTAAAKDRPGAAAAVPANATAPDGDCGEGDEPDDDGLRHRILLFEMAW